MQRTPTNERISGATKTVVYVAINEDDDYDGDGDHHHYHYTDHSNNNRAVDVNDKQDYDISAILLEGTSFVYQRL